MMERLREDCNRHPWNLRLHFVTFHWLGTRSLQPFCTQAAITLHCVCGHLWTIGVAVRMSILDTNVDGSIPSIYMFSPWARDFICIASVDSAVKWVPGVDNLVKGVQCYELFGGIALKIHTFSFHFHYERILLKIVYSLNISHAVDYCDWT